MNKNCKKSLKLFFFALSVFCSFNFLIFKNYNQAKSFLCEQNSIYLKGEFTSPAFDYAAVFVKATRYFTNYAKKINADISVLKLTLSSISFSLQKHFEFAVFPKESYTVKNRFINVVRFLQTFV